MCSAENSTVVFVKFQLRDLKQNKLIFFKVRCAWVCGLFFFKYYFPIHAQSQALKFIERIFQKYFLFIFCDLLTPVP